jgi:hypothetical protein
MAHFAKLDENNVVIAVHVVNNNVITVNGVESEQVGIDFLTSLHGHNSWKQASYNGKIRKNYPSVNFIYDAVRDAFIEPEPFGNLGFDEDTCQWIMPEVEFEA